MTLIKVDKHILEKESSNLINFYRKNPVIAANQLLKVDGDPLHLAPIQQVVLNEWWSSNFSILTASRGSGKSVSHGTNILTEMGWLPVEKLKVGDKVLTPKCSYSAITGVYPQGYIKTCKIILKDKRYCHCSYDHWWKAKILIGGKERLQLVTASDVEQLNKHYEISIPTVNKSIKEGDVRPLEWVLLDTVEDSINQECSCIKIEDPEGLFIIDDYIVTHNTFMSGVYIALQTLLYPSTSIGIFAPAFRQSKFIFKEFENLYQNSPILQQCVSKVPTYGNDQCICSYKPISKGIKPSEVRALPVGTDGGKIRGFRFKRVILDEIPHMPEVIFRSAIHPMMSTATNPMKKVREIELAKKLGDNINLMESTNGYIGITSGYYQFNYWWNEILKFYNEIKSGSKQYSLRFIPYHELPDGFYDMGIVRDAELHAPKHMYLTEWLADWISDSEGAFSMSLLESVRDISVKPKYSKDPNTDKGKEFIFGIDVARESDSSAITVWELGYPSKLVFIDEYQDMPFPEQSKRLFDLIDRFKPIMIYMDEFGGGHVLRDHLANPEGIGLPQSVRVIEVGKVTKDTGKAILKLCNFNSAFIEDANNDAKTLLEQRAVIIPDSTNPIDRSKRTSSGVKVVDLVQEMINQISSVVISQTTTGRLHYDLPKQKGSSNNPHVVKKDLYTAFILGCKCVYDLQWQPKMEKIMVDKGVIREMSISTDISSRLSNQNIVEYPYSTISNRAAEGRVSIKGGGVILRKHGRRK